MAYAPLKEVSSMNEEERIQHCFAVNAALGLDPSLQLLKYVMMEKGDGSGEKHLVLYSTKGATDAMRRVHGISVTDLVDKVIGGAIVFTAKGADKTGRTDIAVGSATIEGKHGRTLENAFMLAQTRASRRLTLQFAGCGLLDESEIGDDKTVSLTTATLPLAEIGKPVPSGVSAQPGTDITLPNQSVTAPAINLPNATTVYTVPDHVGINVEVPAGANVTVRTEPAAIQIPSASPIPVEEKRLPNPAAGLKALAPTMMSAPDAVAPLKPAEQENAAVGPTTEQVTTRRKRRTKAEMEAAKAAEAVSKPEVTSDSAPAPQAPLTTASQPATVAMVAMAPETPGAAPEVVAQPTNDPSRTVPILGTAPTAEQMKAFVDRLSKFRDQCQANGMIPSQGMGPNRKVREFCKIVNRGSDLNNLTVEQWENTFRFLTDTVQQHGWTALISFMEQQIGVTGGQATA